MFAWEYINNFLKHEAIPGITFEYEFVKNYLNGITLDEVNTIAQTDYSQGK